MSSPNFDVSQEIERLLAAGIDPAEAADAAEAKLRRDQYIRFWEPIPEQRKFFDLYDPAVHKQFIIFGGNRGGKTVTTVFLALAFALGEDYFKGYPAYEWVKKLAVPEPPNTIWYVGLDYNVLRDVIIAEKLLQGADHPPMLPAEFRDAVSDREGNMYVEFPNRSVIRFKSAESGYRKLGAAAVDLVCIDEECEKDVADECYQRTVSRAGKYFVSLTPLTDSSSTVQVPWVFDLKDKADAGDPTIAYCQLSVLANPTITDAEKEGLKRKWVGTSEEAARLYGGEIRRGGLVYPFWVAAPPLWVPSRDIPDRGYFRAVCIDPASTGPVAAVWAAYDSKGKQTVYRVYKERGLAVSEHIQNIMAENRGDLIDLWVIDQFAGRQTVQASTKDQQKTVLQVWRDAGIPRLRLADITAEKALEESREYLKAALDPTSPHPPCEIFDNCELLRQEIEKYTLEVVQRGSMRGLSRDKPRKGFDDCINAWQYLCGLRLRYRGPRQVPLADPQYRT